MPTAVAERVFDPEKTIRISDFYKPWEKQRLFHESPAKHRLQVGGFGSGKSKPLLLEAIIHAQLYPGSNSIILRKTIPDLKRTVIDKFLNDIPKSLYEKGSQERGTYNKSDHIVYFPPCRKTGLQSKLYFAACERVEDVGKYLSTEFVFVGFEEMGEFPYLIYDAMEGRNRCTLPGARPCMAGATNPMGEGWGWIRKLFVEHKPIHGMDPDKYDPDDYFYVHSTVDDNPILSQDEAYILSLEKSPLRDKVRWGKLENVSGQYFRNFVDKRHVLPRSHFIFESWQPVWIGWDYGFGHYAVITFMTKAILRAYTDAELKTCTLAEALLRSKPRIVNVCIEELVLQEKTPEQQTQALIAAIPRLHDEDHPEIETGYAWDIDSIHFSWERFNRTVSNRTVADEVGDYLSAAGLPKPSRSNSDRIAGWTKMYELFDNDELLFVQGKCETLVDAIPDLVRGDGVTCSAEDVRKPKGISLADDCGDSVRYAVAGVLLDPADKPKEQLLRDKLAGIKDPLTRQIVAYKEYNKEQAAQNAPRKGAGIVPSWVKRVKN